MFEEQGLTTCGHLGIFWPLNLETFLPAVDLSVWDDTGLQSLPVLCSLDSLWSVVSVLPRPVFWPLLSFMSFAVRCCCCCQSLDLFSSDSSLQLMFWVSEFSSVHLLQNLSLFPLGTFLAAGIY